MKTESHIAEENIHYSTKTNAHVTSMTKTFIISLVQQLFYKKIQYETILNNQHFISLN